MYTTRFLIGSLLAVSASTLHAQSKQITQNPIHIDLEATGQEYSHLIERHLKENKDIAKTFEDVLAAGKRNLEWVSHINSFRPEETQIQLSSAETQVGYPITAPTVNNEALIAKDFETWKSSLAPEISSVLFGNTALPKDPPVSDAEFAVISRKIDRLYQRTSRWQLQQPYMLHYRMAAKNDLRGYYLLSTDEDIDSKLSGWDSLSSEEQSKLQPLLVTVCYNNDGMTKPACQRGFTAAAAQNEVLEFYKKYLPGSVALWAKFFVIPKTRTDVTWNSQNANLMSIPFADPKNNEVLNWLRTNIEDEWKWMGWQLKLNFLDSTSPDMTHVEFEAGATPHVNGIAGSIITMDANRSLNEYNSRWTIRHEYGHVLGFPDCYLEFFDESLDAMISYQLDITNLMCSRRGSLQQKHFDQLKEAYFKIK